MRRSVGIRVLHVNAKFLMQALPFWKVSTTHNCTALKERNEHLWYVSNVNFFHGILLKTKEVGVLEWFLLAALVVSGLVYEYRMHSLTKKIGILENEYCALKSSLEREQGDLKISLSSIERSIESLEDKVDRIKNEDIHDIKDDISFLKSWLKNVGKIATSTRDKLNPSMDD